MGDFCWDFVGTAEARQIKYQLDLLDDIEPDLRRAPRLLGDVAGREMLSLNPNALGFNLIVLYTHA